MADVLLARVDGIEGFERHVVIKKIRDEQARDQRFVQMFLDEARLAASLHHHNIVHVHDIGQENGEYFFTMEYVHGEDLRKILSHMAEHDRQVPLDHCVTIGLATAAALHHAHEHRGPDRKLAGIVHRDVSPANILVGFDGNVKVVDFGIAKVAQRSEETGLMKGKVAYMSPEQCVGQSVDRRSDIFCLGIVLYELVTVRRLFKGANDFLTMSSILHGVIPRPSEVRPEIPEELERIILKALAGDAGERYQTADEMRAALERFAQGAKLQTSTTALADYMRGQFGERPVPWLVPVAEDDEVELSIDFDGSASGIVATPLAAAAAAAIEGFMLADQHAPIMRARNKAITGAPPTAPADVVHASTTSAAMRPAPMPARRKIAIVGAIAAVVGIAIAVIASAGSSNAPAAAAGAVPVMSPQPPPPLEPVIVPPERALLEPPPPAVLPASQPVKRTAQPMVIEPVRPAAGRPVKPPRKPIKGVWDPKALLPPK